MRTIRQPDVLLLLGMLLLTAGGAILLAQPFSTQPDEREQKHFQTRQYFQSTFDALSATVGSGLTVRTTEYTAHGRRILVGLGVGGGLLYLAAAWAASRQLRGAIGAGGATPGFFLVLTGWLVVVVLNGLILIGAGWQGGTSSHGQVLAADVDSGTQQMTWPEPVLLSAAALSVGADPSRWSGALVPAWAIALCGMLAALGWPLWLFIVPKVGRQFTYGWVALRRVLRMLVLWLAIAGMMVLLEKPLRSVRADRPATRSAPTGSERIGSSVTQVFSAAGAGAAVQPLDSRSASSGTQFLLGLVALIGGLAGSPNGGIHSVLAGLGIATMLGCAGAGYARSGHATMLRCREAAVRAVGSMFLWAVVVTLGLLIIQRLTASPFDERPGFSAAWLDACSAVGGAALTSGVIDQVTNPNLTGGIGQSADTYQYGLVWLMLAMVVGRVLPVRILRRSSEGVWHDMPAGGSPIL